jgi:hypothetical protein
MRYDTGAALRADSPDFGAVPQEFDADSEWRAKVPVDAGG